RCVNWGIFTPEFESSMSLAQQELTDLTIHPPSTRMRGVKGLDVEWRPRIAGFPECPALHQYRIIHVRIMVADAPMRLVRTKQTTAYFLACVSGKGTVLFGGRWRTCGGGYACLMPAHTLNAFEAVRGVRWEFCWVCYQQPLGQRPIADASSPVMARFEWLPL